MHFDDFTNEDAGHLGFADRANDPVPVSSPLADLCAAIRFQHRQRVYAMEQRKRANLALGSFLRLMLGWSHAMPKDEQDIIRAQAADLLDAGDRYVKHGEVHDYPGWSEFENIIVASIKAREPFDVIEASNLKNMKKLAKQLPVWSEWGEAVHGFGEASLAVIVAEAGELSAYPKKGHLWKRMGLAVMDGTRQGGLTKNAAKEDWIEHGYNAQRRSRMWNIGDALVKAHGPYREVYLARKEYERTTAEAAGLIVAPSAKIPAKRQSEFISDGHIHRRAQRYMEKRLLRDLWQAWNHRKALLGAPERDGLHMPSGDTVEREAQVAVPQMAVLYPPLARPLDGLREHS